MENGRRKHLCVLVIKNVNARVGESVDEQLINYYFTMIDLEILIMALITVG